MLPIDPTADTPDPELLRAISDLADEVAPVRDLWPGIERRLHGVARPQEGSSREAPLDRSAAPQRDGEE